MKKEGMGYNTVAKKLCIYYSMDRRWVKHYENEGMKGLEEKRGKSKGPKKGRPRIRPENPEVKIKRLEAEVDVKKALKDVKGGMENVPTQKKFTVIHEMAVKTISIRELCEIEGVSASEYYKWVKRQKKLQRSSWRTNS